MVEIRIVDRLDDSNSVLCRGSVVERHHMDTDAIGLDDDGAAAIAQHLKLLWKGIAMSDVPSTLINNRDGVHLTDAEIEMLVLKMRLMPHLTFPQVMTLAGYPRVAHESYVRASNTYWRSVGSGKSW